jgi:NTP pyrophosphatase (non-canonical NTP hydrolase)
MLRFPRTKFVDSNPLVTQIQHVSSEVHEAYNAGCDESLERTAEELFDVIHSAETALRILQERHGVDIEAVGRQVVDKNRERGYYL